MTLPTTNSYHFVPYPVNEDCLCLLVVSLACHVSSNTIQVYLSGLRFFNIQMNQSDPFPSMLRLKLLLRGIKQGKGNQPQKPPTLPITITALDSISHKVFPGKYLRSSYAMVGLLPCILWLSPGISTYCTITSYLPGCTLLVSYINIGIDSNLHVYV